MLAPGVTQTLVGQFVSQSEHRKSLESRDMWHEIILSYLGVIFAFVLALASILAGAFIVREGQPVWGILFGGGGLSLVIVSFIYGTNRRGKNLITRAKIMRGEPLDE